MNKETHSGYSVDANVQENAEGGSVPLVADIKPEALFPTAELPEVASEPTPRTLERDVLDETADKVGSYAIARARLDMPEQGGDFSADAMTARLAAGLAPLSPQGKSTGRYVSGAQLSEEAFPVVDQRLTETDAAHHHAQLDEKIHPILHETAIRLTRKNAERNGINPDLAERLYIEKHAS